MKMAGIGVSMQTRMHAARAPNGHTSPEWRRTHSIIVSAMLSSFFLYQARPRTCCRLRAIAWVSNDIFYLSFLRKDNRPVYSSGATLLHTGVTYCCPVAGLLP